MELKAPVPFMYLSGTMILDELSGRRPVIVESGCAYPTDDITQQKGFRQLTRFEID